MSIAVFLLICLFGFIAVMLVAWLLFRANDGFDVQTTLDRSLTKAIRSLSQNEGNRK